ncbi:MAG: hydantoinase/oxoprolinase family protein [Opitutaceae bacterium]|nr:hydantoinase/oxoprolinase family protein [Opitutaceae bacterium]
MTWRIGIDTGGTFTDLVGINSADGRLLFHKVHSTPHDPGEALCTGVRQLCAREGVAPAAIALLIHGSTVATNAVLERKGARTAFITTAGFRDVLVIQRQNRPRLYDIRGRRPAPVVPRELICEVGERILGDGTVETPLAAPELAAVIERLRAARVESVAVGFLNSYVNPAHELAARDQLARGLPGVKVCLSHEVIRSQGEYERFSTCALNSYVQPKMQGYLDRLCGQLRAAGLPDAPFIMKSNGGMTTAAVAGERSVETLLSGPAGGVVAGLRLAADTGRANLITADVGGTSFDVSVIHGGRPAYASRSEINGLALNVPMVDIHTVGAGGGSIGWIDAGGALRAGPQSAGAVPGPVCYGRGGTEPTVTDANLVLGRLAARSNLAGGMDLDLAAAREAVRVRLADRLNLGVEEAAEGIIRVVNARMTAAIRKLTVERGHDPAQFSLCIFGGAGPLHGAELAEETGMAEVIVPVLPGVFSAFGLLLSEMREEQMQTWLKPLAGTDAAELAARFDALAREAAVRLGAGADGARRHRVDRRLQLRFQGQSHTLAVDVPAGPIGLAAVAAQFHAAHRRLYGYTFEADPIEIVTVWAVVTLDTPPTPTPPYVPAARPSRIGERPVYLEGRMVPTPVHDRFALVPGTVIAGPAIIEQPDTTTLVLPHQHAAVDPQGNLVLRSRPRT